MPNTGPTSKMISKWGLNIPQDTGLPIDKKRQNKLALESQADDPTWKKAGRAGIDVATNLIKGMFGVEPEEDESYWGRKANLGAQMVQAGLPLPALLKGRNLLHGTSKVFNKFNPNVYDKRDTLGWMTHATTNPKYADDYAFGTIKHGSPLGARPNMLNIKPEAQNVLDLMDPNADDMSQALASLSPSNRAKAINEFKNARQKIRLEPVIGKGMLAGSHYPKWNEVPADEVPIRVLADRLRLSPEEFDKTPFDAIRYRDVDEESYAFPSRTPIKSKYGASLTDDPKQLKVIRDTSNRPYTGKATRIDERGYPILSSFLKK